MMEKIKLIYIIPFAAVIAVQHPWAAMADQKLNYICSYWKTYDNQKKKSEANHQINRRVPFMPIQPASLNATRLHAPDEQKEKTFRHLERMKDEKHKINMIKPGMKHKIEQPVYFLITHVPLFLFISCIQEKKW